MVRHKEPTARRLLVWTVHWLQSRRYCSRALTRESLEYFESSSTARHGGSISFASSRVFLADSDSASSPPDAELGVVQSFTAALGILCSFALPAEPSRPAAGVADAASREAPAGNGIAPVLVQVDICCSQGRNVLTHSRRCHILPHAALRKSHTSARLPPIQRAPTLSHDHAWTASR